MKFYGKGPNQKKTMPQFAPQGSRQWFRRLPQRRHLSWALKHEVERSFLAEEAPYPQGLEAGEAQALSW